FLAGEPVRAKRRTPSERLGRWMRRHRAAVLVGAFVTLLATIGLSVAAVTFAGLEDDARNAYAEEARQRQRAEARSRTAWRAVDDMYTQVAEKWLAHQPHMQGLQREFLEKALAFYEEYAEENGSDPASAWEVGSAYRRLGDIHYWAGRFAGAAERYTGSIERLKSLAEKFPDTAAYRREEALGHMQLSYALHRMGQ